MRSRSQWAVGLGAFVVLIATTAATGIVAVHLAGESASALASDYADDVARVERLRFLAERLVATSRGYLLSNEASQRDQFEIARSELVAALGQLAVRSREAEGVVRIAFDYAAAASRATDERAAMKLTSQIVTVFDQMLVPHAELEAIITSFTRHRRELFEGALRGVDIDAERAQALMIASSIMAIACGAILAILVSRRLARQFRAVEAATAAAEEAAKAREEVLAVVSHDLRNPLQAISMSATLVEETSRGGAGARYVRTIHNAAERMRHMIDELLEASRIDHDQIELHREPVTSGQLLDEAVELFRETARARHVELTYEAPTVQVLADRERVLEILSNLLGNALKFSPNDTRIAARAEPSGDAMRFSIADDGPGIAADQIPHLFDRFWQGDRKKRRDGLGLGLYICKRLVEAHHGAIGCDSTLGAGTTFWFTLPKA